MREQKKIIEDKKIEKKNCTADSYSYVSDETSHILYIMISKHEVEQIKEIIHRVVGELYGRRKEESN